MHFLLWTVYYAKQKIMVNGYGFTNKTHPILVFEIGKYCYAFKVQSYDEDNQKHHAWIRSGQFILISPEDKEGTNLTKASIVDITTIYKFRKYDLKQFVYGDENHAILNEDEKTFVIKTMNTNFNANPKDFVLIYIDYNSSTKEFESAIQFASKKQYLDFNFS